MSGGGPPKRPPTQEPKKSNEEDEKVNKLVDQAAKGGDKQESQTLFTNKNTAADKKSENEDELSKALNMGRPRAGGQKFVDSDIKSDSGGLGLGSSTQ